jgi:hypothetical protein
MDVNQTYLHFMFQGQKICEIQIFYNNKLGKDAYSFHSYILILVFPTYKQQQLRDISLQQVIIILFGDLFLLDHCHV